MPIKCFEQTRKLIEELPDNELKSQLDNRFNPIFKKRQQVEKDIITIKSWIANQGSETNKETIKNLITSLPDHGVTKANLENMFNEHCPNQQSNKPLSRVSAIVMLYEGLRPR